MSGAAIPSAVHPEAMTPEPYRDSVETQLAAVAHNLGLVAGVLAQINDRLKAANKEAYETRSVLEDLARAAKRAAS